MLPKCLFSSKLFPFPFPFPPRGGKQVGFKDLRNMKENNFFSWPCSGAVGIAAASDTRDPWFES